MPASGRITFREGPIEGVVLRSLKAFEDARGWLIELYRLDELAPANAPAMAYLSLTLPGVARGPHEHREQTDCFAFVGPGDFRLYLWDSRPGRATNGNRQTLVVGQSNRQAILVPPGVVHAYRNVSDIPALVFNCPNRLYAGPAKQEPVDEIRHECEPDSPYLLD